MANNLMWPTDNSEFPKLPCTCNREELDDNEHYTSCPEVLTPTVLRQMGYDVAVVVDGQWKGVR